MAGVIEGVKTVSSAVRTVLLALLVAVIGGGAFFGYREYTARERLVGEQAEKLEQAEQQLVSLKGDLQSRLVEIERLNVDLQLKVQQIEKLETALHLLKTDQRLAQLRVKGITRDEAGGVLTSQLEFVELSPTGDAMSAPKLFELPGDVIYIDNWVVKFDDEYIERADLQRGTSLCLFRRIFSEQQVPTEGFSLDAVGMRPQAYARGGAMTEFEQQLWSEFWEFANNPKRAAELGIRAANGEAVSIKVREGMQYNIQLRASGGLSIDPVKVEAP